MAGIVAPPQLSAVTLSGVTCARAPNRQSIIRNPVIPRAPQGAGCTGFTTVPSGATTLIVEDGYFKVPALPDAVEESLVESILELEPEDGDAVIIGTADHVFFAELGAYAAGLELLS